MKTSIYMLAESCNVFGSEDESIDWGDLTDHPLKNLGWFETEEAAQAEADEMNKTDDGQPIEEGDEKYFVIEIKRN